METTVGSYEAGQIQLLSRSGSTTISIHWPFDRETDEWVDLNLLLDDDAVRRGAAPIAASIRSGQDIFQLQDRSDGVYALTAEGRNAVSPVSLECLLNDRDALTILRHLSAI